MLTDLHVRPESIALRITTARNQRMLQDNDLAAFHKVEINHFNEAVKRNLARFPSNIMF
jgi:hypothetical protein